MKIKKIKNNNFNFTNIIFEKIHTFYKKGYKYTIEINKTYNIIKIIKEDIKTDFFEINFFEII